MYISRKVPRLNRGTLASEIINDLGVIFLYYPNNICNCYPELKEKEDGKPHDIIMNDMHIVFLLFHFS